MDKLSQGQIIGIDVCGDWLDIYCLPDEYRRRLRNDPDGHAVVAELAKVRNAMVCFESTGGHEWQLWCRLVAEGIVARQVPPAQVKAFARSRGRRAKTDRIDAELIARFSAFRPEAGRRLPAEKLRLLRARKAPQGHHHRRCPKARHPRQQSLQEPSSMGAFATLTDTVAMRSGRDGPFQRSSAAVQH